jgi:hypothetical protein
LHDEVLVKVWVEIMVRPVRDRDEARRIAKERAEALAAQLEEDRVGRMSSLLARADSA